MSRLGIGKGYRKAVAEFMVDRRLRSELLAHAAPLPFRPAETARQEPKVNWKKPAAEHTAPIEFDLAFGSQNAR